MTARYLFALLFALALVLGAGSAAAQAPSDAGAHFDRGVSFFRDGDYTAAMVEFKKAYEIDPNYRVLYNLGQTSRELRDYAAALVWFEKYLAEGGAKIDADRKKKVEGWVAELRGKIATVSLSSNADGAEVSVDDIAVGTTPLAKPLVVNAGRRKISLVKNGYSPRSQYIDVAGTETKELQLDLSPLVAPGGEGRSDKRTEAPSPQPTPGPESRGTARPWVMLGVTAALGVATGVTGGIALAKKSDFEDALGEYPTSTKDVDDARAGARTFAAVADVLAAITVASGVATIVLFATDGSSNSAPAKARVELGPSSLHVRGSF